MRHKSVRESQKFDSVHASLSARIESVCTRYRRSPVDRDDLRQAARVALWRSMNLFDPSRGTPLEHYVSRAMRRAVAKEANKEGKHWSPSRIVPDWADDGDQLPEDGLIPRRREVVPHVDDIVDRVFLQQLDQWVQTLPENLQRVYQLRHVESLSQADTARELGVSQQRVSTLERKLRTLMLAACVVPRIQ